MADLRASLVHLSSISKSITSFFLDLYKQLASGSSNVLMSPASASIALCMVHVGARGETAKQMRSVMKIEHVPDKHLHSMMADLLSNLNLANDDCELHIASRLYGEKSQQFLKEYVEAVKRLYKAEVDSVDFQGNPEIARQSVNYWVAKQTIDKIPELLAPGSVQCSTKLLLVNAIYFNSKWEEPFDNFSTREDMFYTSDIECLPVKMMYRRGRYAMCYNTELDADALEIPYVGKKLTMMIILPRSKSGLLNLEDKLHAANLEHIQQALAHTFDKQQIKLYLPSFKINESNSLEKGLSSLGMKDLFLQRAADLSGMDGTRDLFISAVQHSACIEVDESGTEAAAATVTVMAPTGVLPTLAPDPVFRADHPFLFVIQDTGTKLPLFLGKLARP